MEYEMRHYQCNSPEAAGRILAACLLADGHLSITELEALERCGMERKLLLNRHRLLAIVQSFYEDLTQSGYLSWNDACQIEPATLTFLAADVQDKQMRRDIMELCSEAVMADRGHCEREAEFLKRLRTAWHLPASPDRQAVSASANINATMSAAVSASGGTTRGPAVSYRTRLGRQIGRQ